MDVPAPAAGSVAEMLVKIGDEVSPRAARSCSFSRVTAP